jgi:hypothetical protein
MEAAIRAAGIYALPMTWYIYVVHDITRIYICVDRGNGSRARPLLFRALAKVTHLFLQEFLCAPPLPLELCIHGYTYGHCVCVGGGGEERKILLATTNMM